MPHPGAASKEMILNRIEFALMNNPIRACVQRHFEAGRLLRMGGRMEGGLALEIGCGQGVGVEIIFDVFRASAVDAFDLDSRMIRRARDHTRRRAVHLWVGDCTSIPVHDNRYDAVFDFGIIHHVEDWRQAVVEIARVLKPGGRFYAEEALGPFIGHRMVRHLLRHPEFDRFGAQDFRRALMEAGLEPETPMVMRNSFGWFIAEEPN